MDAKAVSELRYKAHTLSTPVEVSHFLSECNKAFRKKSIGVDVHAELKYFAFVTLHRLCKTNFDDARSIFLKSLLPMCLKSFKGTSKADLHAYRTRELFGQWFNELSSSDCQSVIQPVIKYLTDHLRGRTFKMACWALGDVGYRGQELVDLLKSFVLNNPGKDGDYALGLLFDLGVTPAEIGQFVDEALRRVQARQYNSTYYSLVMSSSLRVLEIIRDHLDSSVSQRTNKSSDLLGVIAGVCERLPNDAGAADLAISLIRRLYKLNQKDVGARLSFANNLLPVIDSRFVGDAFADLFLDLGPEAAHFVHAIYVQILRMRECLGPHQLAGFPSCSSPRLVDILKSVVFTEEENNSPNGSLLFDAKSASLWTALALESYDSLNWFSEALEHERNPFHQHDLMQTYACFRIQTLPDQIRLWVTDPFDAQKNDNAETWITRTSALRVARSAANQEAFDILLRSGFTLAGNVLLDTVNALKDVVLVLTQDPSKCGNVSDALLNSIHTAEPGPQYSAAVHAILAMACCGRLPLDSHGRLVDAALRESQIDYDQARLIEALIHANVPMTEAILNRLGEWARVREDRVGEIALQWLIRIGRLDLAGSILNRLGVECDDGVRHWRHLNTNTTGWAPFFVGQLYEKWPVDYEFAIIDILNDADWQECAQIYGVLQRMAEKPANVLSPQIRQAALSRLIKKVTPTQAELGLFSLVPRVAPEEFLDHDWKLSLDQWFADARIAFAEGVRSCLKHGVVTQSRNKGMQLLIRLSEDSQYGVRRAAFRALAEQDISTLCMLTRTWSRSERHEVRIWAAESAGWIERINNNNTEWEDVLTRIQFDTHKKVRSAYSDALKCRRKRQWANDYLGRMKQLLSPSNAEMLAAWRYGWALSNLSDDDDIQELQALQADIERAPNVRHYIALILKTAEKQWDECKKKWPDPILPLRGTSIEAGSGSITVGTEQWNVDYILWGEPSTGPSALGQWGGRCQLTGCKFNNNLFGNEAQLRTEDGRTGVGFVQKWSNFTDLEFCGSGDYPKLATVHRTNPNR